MGPFFRQRIEQDVRKEGLSLAFVIPGIIAFQERGDYNVKQVKSHCVD